MSSDDELDTYDPAHVPDPHGLVNTGVICHFNALLQALVSCSSVVKTVLANRDYLGRTATGRSLYDHVYVAAPASRPPGAELFGRSNPAGYSSATVLAALVGDLRARRPQIRYGPSQESASEGLVLLLDMLDDPFPIVIRTEIGPTGTQHDVCEDNPVARLFYHRQEVKTYCASCRQCVSTETDVAVQFNLMHYDTIADQPKNPSEFGEMLRSHISKLEEYRCERCNTAGEGYRNYRLCMVPEIIVCVFNLYNDLLVRRPRYYPKEFVLPGLGGKSLSYKQVAQVEQSGGLNAGHYIARGMRRNGETYLFNDYSFSISALGPTANTYMVFYNYAGRTG